VKLTDQPQRDLATDIQRSVIVQAPAGSGKTTLLVHRYLKLLAVVSKPEEILAITFTIKAAAEMRERVIAAMRQRDLIALPALARSDELGWNLLADPRRLRIQTIDSFSMGLARAMPRASGMNPATAPTELTDELYQQAADAVLIRLYHRDPFEQEIADFLRQCGNEQSRARRLLASMLAKRDQWLPMVSAVMQGYRSAPESLPNTLNAGSQALSEALIATFTENLSASDLATLRKIAALSADNLGLAFDDEIDQFRALGELLTTAGGTLRKRISKNEGLPPEHKEAKADLMAVLENLREEQLEEQAANLRYMPRPHQDTAMQRLISICVCLTLAAIELKAAFSRSGSSDFTELMLSAQQALGAADDPSDLALALDHRLAHILVDEFQDTSVSQFHLFEQLLEGWSENDGNSFFAVGDPMQSIYRFRDADVGLFYRAVTSGIAGIRLEPVVLQSNFRSTPALIQWCNLTFSAVLGQTQDPVLGAIAFANSTATRELDAASNAQIRLSDSLEQQCQLVVSRVQELLDRNDNSSIAILVRSRPQLVPLLAALKAAAITWQASDIDSLASKPVVHDLLAIAALVENPENRQALFSILRAPWCGLLLSDLQHLNAASGILSGEDEYPERLSDDARSRLQRLRDVWHAALAAKDELPPRAVVENFWIQMGGCDAYDDPSVLDHAASLLELIDRHCPYHLDTTILERAATRLFASDHNIARLQIMTIHKAKGLEFDHVLLPFLERTTRADDAGMLLWRALPDGLLLGCPDDGGVYDWLKREETVRARHERERLLYVACTRARDTLQLFATLPQTSTQGDHESPRLSTKPPRRSLLELLWPQVSELIDTGEISVEQYVADNVSTVPIAETGSSPESEAQWLRRRLVSDYRWQPPVARPPLRFTPGSRRLSDDEISSNVEVALGIIIHRDLELLAQRALPEPAQWIDARAPSWRRQAQGLGVASDLLPELLQQAATQIRSVLEDQRGRWILSARDQAFAEYPLSFVTDSTNANTTGEVAHLIIDRLFLADGQRWLVDYKTASPEPQQSTDAFIAAEITRYRGQLRRYQQAAAEAFGGPLRVGVYFTALPHLEVIG
jgi:ATP-dependent exoDNAse (exonuclease V) beta subunit